MIVNWNGCLRESTTGCSLNIVFFLEMWPGHCVHSLTPRGHRERPESGIYFKIFEITQYLMNTLYFLRTIRMAEQRKICNGKMYTLRRYRWVTDGRTPKKKCEWSEGRGQYKRFSLCKPVNFTTRNSNLGSEGRGQFIYVLDIHTISGHIFFGKGHFLII